MYKSTFLFSTLIDTCEDSASRSCYQEQGDAQRHLPFLQKLNTMFQTGNQPGKNGQKIGIMITLVMKVIMQSGTPTLT